MSYLIKELRTSTGMTQKKFADEYGIPLSTLRKWEQGGAAPAPYVLSMLAKLLPAYMPGMTTIEGRKDEVFYYDEDRKILYDMKGTGIPVNEDLKGVKKENLILYLEDLFEGYYEIREKFERDVRYDKVEDIIWEKKG